MDTFVQFGLIVVIVLGISVLIKLLKQPLIIGYILSGILVGPFFLNLIQEGTIDVFAEFGVAFLLFIVGLHLSPKIIKEVGKVSLITGLGQIIFTSSIGFLIAWLLGFSFVVSLYIAIALTFSSTIIIMKLLSDKDALEKLYGKIAIGFLLVQDIVVVLMLLIISSLDEGPGFYTVLPVVLRGILAVAVLFPFSYYLLPKFSDFLAKSQELLFLFSIAWGLGFSLLFLQLGFTIEVGALMAGIMLSSSPYVHEISSKLKPLRDFFVIFFFILLGGQMVFADISHLILPAAIFSLFILIGNPLVVIVLMGLLGHSKKNGFMAGLTVAQISEFSLILIALGVRVGHLTQEVLSFVTIIGLVTIAGSTYMITYSEGLYNKISPFLKVFEKKNVKKKEIPKKKYDYILFGCNRIGYSIINSFSKSKKDFLVVDHNPDTVKKLNEENIDAIYGDAEDSEFLEDLEIEKASMIISTVPDKETNQIILNVVERKKANTKVILTARQINEALDLYNSGADYVILPHFLGGDYASRIIEDAEKKKGFLKKERKKELDFLKGKLKRYSKNFRVDR